MSSQFFPTDRVAYPTASWHLFGHPTGHTQVGLMMVCTGNICRSAMAQQVASQGSQTLAYSGLLGGPVAVASTGISDEEHGGPLDRRGRQVLQAHGWEVSPHRARQINTTDLQSSDLFLVMTQQHYRYVRALGEREGIHWGSPGAPRLEMYSLFLPKNVNRVNDGLSEMGLEAAQVDVLSEFGVEQGWWSLRDLDVPDPWYGGPQDFEETLRVIEAATGNILMSL